MKCATMGAGRVSKLLKWLLLSIRNMSRYACVARHKL